MAESTTVRLRGVNVVDTVTGQITYDRTVMLGGDRITQIASDARRER